MVSDDARKPQVGIILVTHLDYGSALLKAAELIAGPVQDCTCIQVDSTVEVEETVHRLKEAVNRLNLGKGVLVLTDMFGGTPTNLSLSLMNALTKEGARKDEKKDEKKEPREQEVDVLTGVNLPMVLRVLQNRQRPLAELAELALEAGCEGIIAAGKVLRSRHEKTADEAAQT
jgi:PTS system mannose-specific IIA component